MQEREKEISVHRDVLKAEYKAAEDELVEMPRDQRYD